MTPPALTQYCLAIPTMPLAVYREVAAHLQQIEGVQTELLPQTAMTFDYRLSQVGGIQISHPVTLTTAHQQRLQDILDYYRQRFGAWQPV
jgi:hypothetical protein